MTVVAGFRVESLVGRGAMGEVYRAVDQDGNVVALKLLDDSLAHDERFRRRFLRESQIAAGLHHPNIVPTISSGEDDGRLYLAMQYIDGEDLRDLLRREGRLDPERAVDLVAQTAAALDTAHHAGLVHRDVKPGNILLDETGKQAYICDFGLARHVASVSSLTGDRGFVGTIDYVPPEQIEGGQIDARADEYSLACVLYECLAGVRPFDRDSELSVVFAHLNEPPPKLTDQRPDLPQAFDDLFATALAKNPDDRYQTCGELAAAARAALAGQIRARRRPRRRLALAVAVVIAVAAAATGVLLFTGKHQQKKLPVTITPTSIGSAKLGDSNITLERLWNGGSKLTTQFPADYSLLRQSLLDVSAYFSGTVDKAVELTTWNANDRTDAGVGPCSTLAELKRAYGKRLKLVPNNHGYGYTVGKHLFFAIGTPPHPRFVSSVAVYSNELTNAGVIALDEGPCTGPASASATPTTTPAAQPSVKPKLTQTFISQRFRPRVTVRAPSGWSVGFDNGHAFGLTSAGRTRTADQVAFFLDPYASAGDGRHPDGEPLTGVSRTPSGLVAWLRANPDLIATRPSTTRFGRPVLSARSIDIDLSAKAPKEDPHCPGPCISYLAFRGPGYKFPYGTGRGEPARLYFALIRIGTEVHTLAITVDSPSKATFRQVLPAASAMVKSLSIDAVPVVELSAFSAYCTPVFYGSCVGELSAGTHRTSTLRPALTYTVPLGWTNFTDHPGVFGLVPPGGDWQAVDTGQSDYLDVITSIATARDGCADGHGSIHTPEGFARWLRHEPGIALTNLTPVTIGGLSGVVVDLRMRKDWKKTCPWSHGIPAQQALTGLPPSPSELNHSMLPPPMVMRLYLLHYKHETLGIEIDEVSGDSKLDSYSAVVKTFRFGG